MTEKLFLDQTYDRTFQAKILSANENGIILDKTLFYATSGGQPGDTGILKLSSGMQINVQTTNKGQEGEDVLHIPANDDLALPQAGDIVEGEIDWELRYKHMRMHTCMHLLCASVVGDVTGGSISAVKSRLDFNIPGDAVNKEDLTEKLNKLIEEDHPIKTFWITEEELASRPELVRTMSVKPPSAAGKVRLVQIGSDENIIDLQPCGGTHVKSTKEVGKVRVSKIENKGRQNRRVNIIFDEE